MSENIEIEFKNLLLESEYHKLIQLFQLKEEDFFTQENIYFDSPDSILKTKKMGLRIRILSDSAELTLKTPRLEGPGLLETTDSLAVTEANLLVEENRLPKVGDVFATLKNLGISPETLTIIGSLKTTRGEYQLDPATLIVLDENWYSQEHDFELEVEVAEATSGKQFFLDFLTQNNIPLRPAKNKILRMIHALNKE